MDRNTNQKSQQKSRIKTRQLIIEQELETARENVIRADIDKAFFERLLKNGIGFPKYLPKEAIQDNLLIASENYAYSLERLNYLKELKNADKDKQALKIATEKAPAGFTVEYNRKENDNKK